MDHIDKFYDQVLHNMDCPQHGMLFLVIKWFFVMLVGYVSHWLSYKAKGIENQFIRSHIVIKGLCAVVVTVLCYQTYERLPAAYLFPVLMVFF